MERASAPTMAGSDDAYLRAVDRGLDEEAFFSAPIFIQGRGLEVFQ